ncbi:hypothetical protein C0995_000261 [Termitomyces sp. Mi166|nr:hypothetical protein C0995_000261 [Termitomyces sp. Mi166\
MRYSFVFSTLAAPLLALAAPARFYGKRAASDVLVFKFADVLEQLENSFYSQAISKFQASDFLAAGYSSSQLPVEQFQSIQSDEATHSQVLQDALKSFGETPITGCNFDFSSVLTDVSTMAATARVVENLGVSAYLGGATLLTDPVLLDSAGSILTVEARHQTILNVLSSTGSAIPAAFDIPFTPGEVLAVASPFISGCSIPIPANTPLTVTNNGTVAPGTLLTFDASTINGTIPDSSLFCQMLVGGNSTSLPLPLSQCVVPDSINGPVALFITSDNQPLINNVRDRAQGNIVAGPTVAFIDTKPELLGQIARSGPNSGSQSTSTSTISPAQASSIVSAAGGASTTGAAAVVVPTSSPAPSTSSSFGGPNNTTGLSADGNIIVNGWSTTSESSSDPSLTSGSAVASAGNASTTGSAVGAVVTASSSSSAVSAQPTTVIASAGPASTSGSTAAIVVNSSSSSSTSSPSSGPNTTTGPSSDGNIVVNGWSESSVGANIATAGSASATGSAVAAVVTSSTFAASSAPSGPNKIIGPSADGTIVVNGWNTGSSSS